MRINRYIASCTQYSRRQADELIKQGSIKVNGQVMTDLSFQVALEDVVELDGEQLVPFKKVYYVVNKPRGFVCSVKDRHAKKLVTDLVPNKRPVFPVGRLDKESRGLIVLTNDGEVAQALQHPSREHEKEYIVVLDREPSAEDMQQLRNGIALEEGVATFDFIDRKKQLTYSVVLHQGWNRQIRRMFASLSIQVVDLQRTRIAKIQLGGLPEGKFVSISRDKIESRMRV